MNKSIYFASDFHLGLDMPFQSSADRERMIVDWMTSIQHDCEALYLVGDIFDYWFEYKSYVPNDYQVFINKIKEFKEKNIPVYFFTGNHDVWMFSYFQNEFNIPVYTEALSITLKGKKFFLAHGDGLGPGDRVYKMMKPILRNKMAQKMYALIPPKTGLSIMKYFSQKGRKQYKPVPYLHHKRERLIYFCEDKLKEEYFDYFLMGHRHLPIEYRLANRKSKYYNLGEWLLFRSYAKYDGSKLELLFFKNPKGMIYPAQNP